MPGFILMNLTVGLTAFLAVKYFFRSRSRTDNILSVFTLFLSQVVFTELILGIAGRLYLANLILVNTIILSITAMLIKVKKPDIKEDYEKSPEDKNYLFSNKTVLFCVSILAGFLIFKSVENIINPPFGWDSLNYHFTFPVEWLKNGNLDTPITICDDPTPTYYPVNGCLFFLWLILPFKSVFLADLGQVPFFIMSFFACYSIARKMGADKEYAMLAAGMFCITPNYFKQIEVGYSDIMTAGLFLISLNYLMIFYKNFNLRNLLFCALSLGLLLGTKTVCLPYVGLLLIFLAYIFLTNIKHQMLKQNIGYILLFFIIFVLMGSFGYIRNFVISGNPFFPLNISLFGKTIFKGVRYVSTYRAFWTAYHFNYYKLFFSEGLGGQFILFFVPAAILALPVIVFKRAKQRLSFYSFYIFGLPLLLFLVFRYIIPQLWVRFLYPFLGVSSVVSLVLADRLRIKRIVIKILIVLCVISSTVELAKRLEWLYALLVSAAIFFIIPIIIKWFLVKRKAVVLRIVVAISVISILAGLHLVHINYENTEFSKYIIESPYWKEATEAWKWVNDNTAGNRIAYVGRPVPLPLYGTGFKNDVYYVSVNEKPPKLHAFKDGHLDWKKDYYNMHMKFREDGNYREKANFDVWYANLRKENTDYLFVYNLHHLEIGYEHTEDKRSTFPIEDRWASAHREKFIPVFANEMVHIYELAKLN